MGTTEAARQRVRRAPAGTFFRTSDFVGPRPAVLTALSRLHSDGALARVRNGLYWKGVNSRFGKGRPDASAAAIALAKGRGVGPTAWSATQALGLSTQVPPIAELAVIGPAPKMEGVRFHTRNNTARRDLSFLEIAVIETLREFPRYAEADLFELAKKIDALELNNKISLKKVEKVATSERSPRLRENLEALRDIRERAVA